MLPMPQALPAEPRPTVGPIERANALRVLCLDAVEKARSGDAAVALRMADVAEVLWTGALRHDPASPEWWDRDRLVLSDGRGAILLYALLHLGGHDVPRSELERFCQLGSRAPGHPEHGVTPGVDATTGPLGQGLANAVGFALAEKLLAARFNRPGFAVVDHHTYAFVGDGCLMEGLSHEAASLAAVHQLGKLVCFWDDAGSPFDGLAERSFRDATVARFEAYGWHVVRGVDGHEPDEIAAAIDLARAETRRPSLVCCRTSARDGVAANGPTVEIARGAPAGGRAAALRKAMGWTTPPFDVPEDVRAAWDGRARGAALRQEWQETFEAYGRAHPELAAELRRRMKGDLPIAFTDAMVHALEGAATRREVVATRKASRDALAILEQVLPELAGGPADPGGPAAARRAIEPGTAAPDGERALRWGVRELGMAAALNGLALHGGFIPHGGTSLVLSDYARSALRMAALMNVRAVFVLTHDSIAVGEAGPAHQPVEHAASLRLVPGLDVWRPCDALETFVAWRAAVERRFGPTAILLSSQALPAQPRDRAALRGVERGGYVLAEAEGGRPRAVLVATGSEVQLAMAARRLLAEDGIPVRVVSMPSTSVFDRQDAEWRAAVLPRGVPRVAIEAGASASWWKYVGSEPGAVVGLDRFGESAPAQALLEDLGFTPERVARVVRSVARRRRRAARTRHQAE